MYFIMQNSRNLKEAFDLSLTSHLILLDPLLPECLDVRDIPVSMDLRGVFLCTWDKFLIAT